jgi:hypothetical protein
VGGVGGPSTRLQVPSHPSCRLLHPAQAAAML